MADNCIQPRLHIIIIIIIIITIIISNIISCAYSINELCPARCKCEDEYLRASCVFATLEVVPIQLNPEIQHLDLSNNKIGSLTLAFGFYDNLQSLDISSNLIHTLGSENFLLQNSLNHLNISNNIINTITKSALKGLESLTVLDLSNNNITHVDSQAFRYVNELREINLSGNLLINLPNGLFNNLHRIKILKLSRNSLLQVPKSNLYLAPSLQLLDLSDNLILQVGHDSIPSLRSLTTLNLANNVIKSINDDAFEHLPALLYLNLDGNNLTHVPTHSLARLTVLSHLILSRNPLGTLNTLAFRNLFELKILDLRQCQLNSINQRAFADNINLEQILLDANYQLQYLPSRLLYNARYLKIVSLRHCKLSTLQPTHFPVDDLKILKVAGNPFSCNCSLHWMWNVIHTEVQRNMTKLWLDSDEIFCYDSEHDGKLLMSLTENSLKCRLSTLYFILLVAGCLAAIATILISIAWITRVKRQKRLPFVPPNRPELLAYVGSTQNTPAKKFIERQCSRDKQFIQPNHHALYDLPYQQTHKNVMGIQNDFHYRVNSNSHGSYGELQKYCRNGESFNFERPVVHPNVLHDDISEKESRQRNFADIYAVTDVTGMIAVDSTTTDNYRMDDNSNFNHLDHPTLSSDNNSDYNIDNEYEYRGAVKSNQTSHVVFV